MCIMTMTMPNNLMGMDGRIAHEQHDRPCAYMIYNTHTVAHAYYAWALKLKTNEMFVFVVFSYGYWSLLLFIFFWLLAMVAAYSTVHYDHHNHSNIKTHIKRKART